MFEPGDSEWTWCVARRAAAIWGLAVQSSHAQSSAVPAPWTAQDIGSPTPAGSSSYDQPSGTFTHRRRWCRISGARRDKFHFVYQQVSGDVDVVARVDSLTQADQWSKSGVMIRASLVGEFSSCVFPRVGREGSRLSAPHAERRAIDEHRRSRRPERRNGCASFGRDAGSPRTSRPTARAGPASAATRLRWVQVRTSVSPRPATIRRHTTVGGLACHLTSRASRLDRRAFPSGQADADIGSPAIKGSASFSQGTYTISAARRRHLGHCGSIPLRLSAGRPETSMSVRASRSLTNTDVWAKAGVMIRGIPQRRVDRTRRMFITPGQGYAFQRRVDDQCPSTTTDGRCRRGSRMGPRKEGRHALHGLQVHGRPELDGSGVGQHLDGERGVRRHRRDQPQCGGRHTRHRHQPRR